MYAKITPHLWFDKEAGEAAEFYTSLFPDSKVTNITKLNDTPSGDSELVSFELEGQWFAAMDSAQEHNFVFNEAISFLVACDTQEEIDRYWERLSAVPEAEQCGWLKDKFGLSWQISPAALGDMMVKGTRDQIARVTQAFLPMKKFDVAELQKAYEGK